MAKANWQTQAYGRVQSLLFNNPNRVIRYMVSDGEGGWKDRSESAAPVRRLYETEADDERSRLQTIQFVHHMIIPPGDRHVQELHIHPDAEELVVILRGEGTMIMENESIAVKAEDVIHIPAGATHELRNTGDELLFCLFINVPVGEGVVRLMEAQHATG